MKQNCFNHSKGTKAASYFHADSQYYDQGYAKHSFVLIISMILPVCVQTSIIHVLKKLFAFESRLSCLPNSAGCEITMRHMDCLFSIKNEDKLETTESNEKVDLWILISFFDANHSIFLKPMKLLVEKLVLQSLETNLNILICSHEDSSYT